MRALPDVKVAHGPPGIVDGRGRANVLVGRMRDLGFEVYEASTPQMAKAAGGFVDSALAGEVSHVGQPILEEALKVVQKRELPMGDFVWNDAEAGVPQWTAVTLAHWHGQARSGGSAHATENPSRSTFGSSFTRPPIWKPTTWTCSSPTTSSEASLSWQNEYRRYRPMVERAIAWLVRGNRKVRYRGVAKNDHWLHHRAAAINLRRLITMGLVHNGAAWALS
jgi:hypothetical protein